MAVSISASTKELLDLFECPVCMDFMFPPIYQCPNGHTLCSKCQPSMRDCCPICREQLGNIRALVLEKMGASIQFPCKYSRMGCSAIMKFDMKQTHEEECSYRPYNCPFPCSPCVVTGDVETLVTHLSYAHESELKDGYEIDTVFTQLNPYDEVDASLNVVVYRCHSENFCLHFEAFPSPVDVVYLAFLTFMGNEINAMDYRYNLEIGSDTHRLSWQGVTRSTREGIDQIKQSLDGLVIHRSVAQKFAEVSTMETLVLRVKGLVWKEQQ